MMTPQFFSSINKCYKSSVDMTMHLSQSSYTYVYATVFVTIIFKSEKMWHPFEGGYYLRAATIRGMYACMRIIICIFYSASLATQVNEASYFIVHGNQIYKTVWTPQNVG